MSTTTLDWKQKPHFMGLLLGGFALLVCVLVATGAHLTAPLIALRTQEDTQKLLDQVIPAELYDGVPSQEPFSLTLDGQTVTGFRARKGGEVTAVALFAETQGYSGPIRLLLGIDAHGVLTGVRVLSHTETPGLGDKIQTNKSDWILGFAGLSLGNPDETGWHVKKDGGQFDGFTGATITPRAVVKGVHESLTLFAKHSAALLDSKE
ncbi:MAG: electron transport complex subunit RsxG [Aeromonadaceae bacterium]|nr:electron transport complex subunit RsxG [Aeromonadaceae bacterium]